MKQEYKIKFFRFLDGQLKVDELESWIYATPALKEELENESYFELIAFDFKNKHSSSLLTDLISKKLIKEGEFFTWKIKALLKQFIESPHETQHLLNDFYRLSTKAFDSQGNVRPGFKFLQNLGLNYLYWMDEGYLKVNYGEYWQDEYKRSKKDLGFYHKQLEPVAKRILFGLDSKQIEILDKDKYRITEELRDELESDEILKIKHKDTNGRKKTIH